MITLHAFGPALGLAEASPFVRKTMLQLGLSGLPYRVARGISGYRRAPKGKLPWIDDDGTVVADSDFIRRHLETRHGVDLDAGHGPRERAVAFAVEQMMEEHFYHAVAYFRWIWEPSWPTVRNAFLAPIPAPVRPLAGAIARRGLRRTLHGQGLGRHGPEEIVALAAADVAAVDAILGDSPFLLGETPCGADCSVAAFVEGVVVPPLDTPLKAAVQRYPRVVAHAARVTARYGRR
jgi:glutathione S-transferase